MTEPLPNSPENRLSPTEYVQQNFREFTIPPEAYDLEQEFRSQIVELYEFAGLKEIPPVIFVPYERLQNWKTILG